MRRACSHRTCWILTAVFATGLATVPALAQEGTGAAPANVDVTTFEVEVHGPAGEATVGQVMGITVVLHLPPGLAFEGIDTVEPGFVEFRDRRVSERPNEGGGSDVVIRLLYVAFRPGEHRIGGFDVRLQRPDGSTVTRRVDGVDLPVISLLANVQEAELRPEKPGVPVTYRDYTLAWVLGISAVTLLFGLLGFVIARNRPRPIVVVPGPPPRPAYEVAIEKLDGIRADNLIEAGEMMAFHVRLSGTIREYLGARYGFDGLEMTTRELLHETELNMASEAGTADATRALLWTVVGNLLRQADLVKFARGQATEESEREALDQAYRLVHETWRSRTIEPEQDDIDDGATRPVSRIAIEAPTASDAGEGPDAPGSES